MQTRRLRRSSDSSSASAASCVWPMQPPPSQIIHFRWAPSVPNAFSLPADRCKRMTVPRQRTFAFAFIAAVCAAASPAIYLLWRHDHRDLMLRAGIRSHSLSSDLNPEGRADALAVEILAAAARRTGLRLQWVECPEGPDRALRSKKVDLWPMTLDLPERRKQFHITEPWLA